MKKTTTIYAEALSDNRNYKNARMDGKTIGVSESRTWNNAVKALRIPAYTVAQYRHANLANSEIATPCDLSPLYAALHTVLDLVGEVNGAKLHAENIAEIVIANASRIRNIDLTVEMVNARYFKKTSEKALEDYNAETRTIENASIVGTKALDKNYQDFYAALFASAENGVEALSEFAEKCANDVKRLEKEPGNCRSEFEINAESAFIKAVEMALGDAINGQCMKSAEQVAAEQEAKRQERRAKTAAKKKAKKGVTPATEKLVKAVEHLVEVETKTA